MDFNALHKQRKVVMIAAAVGLIMMLLNIRYGLGGQGLLYLLAFGASGYMAYAGNQAKPMSKNSWLITLACGGIILLLFLIDILRFGTVIIQFAGFEFWLTLLAAAAIVAGAYLFRDPSQDLKQSLSEMKKQVENKLDNDPNT